MSSSKNYDKVSEALPTPSTVNVRVLPETLILTAPPSSLVKPSAAEQIPLSMVSFACRVPSDVFSGSTKVVPIPTLHGEPVDALRWQHLPP